MNGWNRARGNAVALGRPDLLGPTRLALAGERRPWVIENVPGAARHMAATVILHGGMFGLGVHRPRLFESNVLLLAIPAARVARPIGVYGRAPDGRGFWSRGGNGRRRLAVRVARSLAEARAAMGIDWMTWPELRESIPPAYTRYIGRQLMAACDR
jgi:DNA (cytosine-5)-methyltransferase 1